MYEMVYMSLCIILYHINNSVFSFWISVLALLFIYKVFKT